MFRPRKANPKDRRSRSGRPSVEFLEARTLLAGNVTTFPAPGTPTSPGQAAPILTILGDTADNEIQIKKGATPDEIIVNGLNGTLVNGSTQERHFSGVRELDVFMNAGNDDVKLNDLALSATPAEGLLLVQVDGGTGDDRITVFNTTINAEADAGASSSVGMILAGDVTNPDTGPSTGNDFIEISNTTITAEGGDTSGAVLQIYGDLNAGATISGGNDHINVSNTVIRATSTSFESGASAVVQIYGDFNTAGGSAPPTSVIGEGNDWINVNGTDIIADSAQGSGTVLVQVYGDSNEADAGGTATIGNFATRAGGNDTISLTNTTVSARGANFSLNSAMVDIRGDQNFSETGIADVGGGNDNISVDNFVVNASGANSTNTADLRIFGDGDVSAALNVTSRIGGGNDVIAVSNVDVTAAGTPVGLATLLLYSDDLTQQGEAGTTVGQGTDSVNLSNFLLEDSGSSNVQLHTQKGNDVVDVLNIRVTGLAIDSGSGDDDVGVNNSNWVDGNFDLLDGNDELTMNGNSFVLTDADGGPGIDTLNAHGNTGILVFHNFEFVNVT